MKSLDPIVSLTVAIAEAPGSFAFFLGSGVSRDAGVPTGDDVWWRAVGELWRLDHVAAETPSRDDLQRWLKETERSEAGYSDVLEELMPEPASRRDYLSKLFATATPGPTHEALADLAVRGLVRVFITTNFDRLLEQALQARGIVPVVVTSDADLRTAPAREHQPCFVMKPHGDYLQETIRNTRGELESLEPAMSAELQSVLNRYGVMVIGYSGHDQGIRTAFKERSSRYGFYWLSRKELPEPARSIVEATGGRNIQRPGAAEFLADLNRRFEVFSQHPDGETPVAVHDETLALLRRGDTVGVRELLRSTHRKLEVALREARVELESLLLDGEVLEQFRAAVYPALEQRLATLLPLVDHAPDLLAEQAGMLSDLRSRRHVRDGSVFWIEVNDFCVRWLGWAIGAYCARRQAFGRLRPLLTRDVVDFRSDVTPLVSSVPDHASQVLARARPTSQGNLVDPTFVAMREDFLESTLLGGRYPELVENPDDLLSSMVEFDMVLSAALGLREGDWLGSWRAYRNESVRFASRLLADETMRADVAEACAVGLDDFEALVPDILGDLDLDNRSHERVATSVASILRQTGQGRRRGEET